MALAEIAVRPIPATSRHWLALLGTSEAGGRDEAPRLEGALPPALAGSLYRNGPGLFERGGVRKPHLLDGDGLVQRLSFAEGKARYQNAFVRTRKFAQEEAAGRYRFATWSMRRPGGMLANLGGGHLLSQVFGRRCHDSGRAQQSLDTARAAPREAGQIPAVQHQDIWFANSSQRGAGRFGPAKGRTAINIHLGHLEFVAAAPDGCQHVHQTKEALRLV